jgi:hypothetical protein
MTRLETIKQCAKKRAVADVDDVELDFARRLMTENWLHVSSDHPDYGTPGHSGYGDNQ